MILIKAIYNEFYYASLLYKLGLFYKKLEGCVECFKNWMIVQLVLMKMFVSREKV